MAIRAKCKRSGKMLCYGSDKHPLSFDENIQITLFLCRCGDALEQVMYTWRYAVVELDVLRAEIRNVSNSFTKESQTVVCCVKELVVSKDINLVLMSNGYFRCFTWGWTLVGKPSCGHLQSSPLYSLILKIWHLVIYLSNS